ncbi:Cytochrome c class I [Candidatus Methylobacter favarea]|uniref:Cytochrome c class I n=1 Tax=Candidatus Methylobacter favarea TaxID=2707345 RepID=A0A8S0X2F3_9GAMM|nr:c-type cytochrome [Candidatus Methylobacter favarea]CAA9891872.1 Cytochrome c class I [Candidatus Methylobacter favarea]
MDLIKPSLILSLLLAWCWTTPVFAADTAAGEQKAATCSGCHGPQGKSSNAQWPNLAAQQSIYLINQLKAFKSGSRKNPLMQPLAASLSEEDINNLAAYFSSQQAAKAGGDPTLAKSGQSKASICLGCHGPSAEGNGQFPRLAGQHPDYLLQQLKNFKQGSREGGPMQAIAASLSEEDMKELAAYFGSL